MIKQNLPNCRRELVNAYATKLTAKKKIWNTAKRLHLDGDKTAPSELPSAGVWEKACLALISAFCFDKKNAFLPTFVAMDKSRCTAAAWAAQAKPDSFRTPK